MSEQITFATSDFASNPEPRCPCILLLDVSGSMNGRPINELNAGLVTFRDELLADSLALKRVELGIVTFGPVHVEQPFTSAANFFPPILFAIRISNLDRSDQPICRIRKCQRQIPCL